MQFVFKKNYFCSAFNKRNATAYDTNYKQLVVASFINSNKLMN